MKPALANLFGKRDFYYSDTESKVTSVGNGRYSLNNPIKADGTLTKYARIVFIVSKNGNLTKREILETMGYTNTNHSYIAATFQALVAGGLIKRTRKGRTFTYQTGEFFSTWKALYL